MSKKRVGHNVRDGRTQHMYAMSLFPLKHHASPKDRNDLHDEGFGAGSPSHRSPTLYRRRGHFKKQVPGKPVLHDEWVSILSLQRMHCRATCFLNPGFFLVLRRALLFVQTSKKSIPVKSSPEHLQIADSFLQRSSQPTDRSS